jgi:hypothetical protein
MLVVAFFALHSNAQETAPHTVVVPAVPAPAPVFAPAACCTVTAGTQIEIEIDEAIDSAQRKRGDKFAISLHAPVMVGGTLILPAGTQGVGEVVHAERARGGGKPGELILAARYLELDGRRIPLRGLKLGAAGVDKTHKAMVISAIPIVGLFSPAVHGGEMQVPKGTLANAKIAEGFSVRDASLAPTNTASVDAHGDATGDAQPATPSAPAAVQADASVPTSNAATKE